LNLSRLVFNDTVNSKQINGGLLMLEKLFQLSKHGTNVKT